MRDAVRYALPFGFVGRFVHAWVVKTELNAIFDFRARTISDLLSAGVRP